MVEWARIRVRWSGGQWGWGGAKTVAAPSVDELKSGDMDGRSKTLTWYKTVRVLCPVRHQVTKGRVGRQPASISYKGVNGRPLFFGIYMAL